MSKVPLVVFKREKEIARKLEFAGLYITEQPSDDDIKGQWDRLVINTPWVIHCTLINLQVFYKQEFNAVVFFSVFTSSFTNNYWDKFVKRKVSDSCPHNLHVICYAHIPIWWYLLNVSCSVILFLCFCFVAVCRWSKSMETYTEQKG